MKTRQQVFLALLTDGQKISIPLAPDGAENILFDLISLLIKTALGDVMAVSTGRGLEPIPRILMLRKTFITSPPSTRLTTMDWSTLWRRWRRFTPTLTGLFRFRAEVTLNSFVLTNVSTQEASLSASLQQLGKSRADLWQFAGLVALERALERANRACDLDDWARQQVSRKWRQQNLPSLFY